MRTESRLIVIKTYNTHSLKEDDSGLKKSIRICNHEIKMQIENRLQVENVGDRIK